MRYLPSWLPGMGFKNLAKKYRRSLDITAGAPYEFTKAQIVRSINFPFITYPHETIRPLEQRLNHTYPSSTVRRPLPRTKSSSNGLLLRFMLGALTLYGKLSLYKTLQSAN